MSETNRILVGKIVAAQGLRGEVRVQTYTENPEDFRNLKIKNQESEIVNHKFIRAAGHDTAILKIEGVDDRNAAESLRGTELHIKRDSLPPLPDGEYYQADLIGMTVHPSGETVLAVHNFGAGDILETSTGEMLSFAGANVDMQNKLIYIK